MRGMIRQGDVLLIPVDLAKAAELDKPTQSGEVVLAHGEATGHRHRFASGAELYELRGETSRERVEHARALLASLPKLDLDAVPIGVVRLEGEQPLVHEEHSAIPCEGDYLALRQREYHPEALRTVAD